MLRSIHWYFNFVFSLSLLYFRIPKYKKLEKTMAEKDFDDEINAITSNWAMGQLRVAGAKVECTGLENIPRDTNCLFVSNHQGNFDPAILMAYLNVPKGFVAKESVKKIFILAAWMELMKSLFIDRENPKKAARILIDGIKILKSGHSLVIFPEGTRSLSSEIGTFKDGAFKMATKAKVPVVPITIDGTYKLMEEGKNIIKPATVKLFIHPMIETKDLSSEEIKNLPDQVLNIIKSEIDFYNSKH